MADKPPAVEQVKKWWKALLPNQKRNVYLGGIMVGVILMIVYTVMSTPAIRPTATTPRVEQQIDPHVFGGGRSNVLALEELDRRLEAEAAANRRMREEHTRTIRELNEARDQFLEWTRTAGLEREAARAMRRLEDLSSRAESLEEQLRQAERQTAGVPVFQFQPDRRERGREEAVAAPDAPEAGVDEPPSPRPEPDASRDDSVLQQDLFTGVGTTPRPQQRPAGERVREAMGARPREEEQPPMRQERRGLMINGRAMAELQQEAIEESGAEERPADTEQTPRPRPSARTRNVANELPASSIISGVLLHGMDAPTGSGARGQPVPLLVRIKDLAIIPNHRSMDLEDCHAIGEGYGSMSEERAFARLIDLVCTKTNGEIIHSPLRGYVVGPDGKVGIRGPVVQRNGALIARSIQAGALSGFGDALGGRRTRGVAITTTGERITDSLGDIAEEGIARGIGNAMSNIAEFYLDQARAIYPVIEISPETPVDIVLTSPLELRPGA